MGRAIADLSMSVPGGFIPKTQHFCIHQDPLIPLSVFLVIASLRHIRSLSEMIDAEADEFAHLPRTTHRAIKEVTRIENLTSFQEEKFIHFHLWFFPWIQDAIERHGSPSLTKIREIMTDLRKQTLRRQSGVN